jgi:hypothetical protein
MDSIKEDSSNLLYYIYSITEQGKLSLLKTYLDICEENGAPCFLIDGRQIEASPECFRNAFKIVAGKNEAVITWKTDPACHELIISSSLSISKTEIGHQLAGQELTEQDFSKAVAEALKYLDSPKKLMKSPLLRSRFMNHITAEITEINLAIILTDTLIKNINKFEHSVKYHPYHRLLYRTYINPVGNQMETAEFLCLSFSTYRRKLKNAVQWIADILWIEEKKLCINMNLR